MRVLFAASVPDDAPNRASAESAFFALGRACAEAGHHLVMGACEPGSPDAWFLDGFKSTGKSGLKVQILRPQQVTSADPAAYRDKLDVTVSSLGISWAAVGHRQLSASDAVLLVGGREHVRNLGYSGAALERAVVALDWFGGSAGELSTAFNERYRSTPGAEPLLERARQGPTADGAKAAVELLGFLHAQRAFRITRLPRWVSRWLTPLGMLGGAVGMLVVWLWLFGMRNDKDPALEPDQIFFALLALSAGMGTLLRNSLVATQETAPDVDLHRLLSELTSGLLLAFGLGLFFLVGSITLTGSPTTVLLTSADAAAAGAPERIAVMMTLLGLAGGFLIEQTADALRKRLSGLSGGAS